MTHGNARPLPKQSVAGPNSGSRSNTSVSI